LVLHSGQFGLNNFKVHIRNFAQHFCSSKMSMTLNIILFACTKQVNFFPCISWPHQLGWMSEPAGTIRQVEQVAKYITLPERMGGGVQNFAGTLPELICQNLLKFAGTLPELCRKDKRSLWHNCSETCQNLA
jgi:hypothetical protein